MDRAKRRASMLSALSNGGLHLTIHDPGSRQGSALGKPALSILPVPSRSRVSASMMAPGAAQRAGSVPGILRRPRASTDAPATDATDGVPEGGVARAGELAAPRVAAHEAASEAAEAATAGAAHGSADAPKPPRQWPRLMLPSRAPSASTSPHAGSPASATGGHAGSTPPSPPQSARPSGTGARAEAFNPEHASPHALGSSAQAAGPSPPGQPVRRSPSLAGGSPLGRDVGRDVRSAASAAALEGRPSGLPGPRLAAARLGSGRSSAAASVTGRRMWPSFLSGPRGGGTCRVRPKDSPARQAAHADSLLPVPLANGDLRSWFAFAGATQSRISPGAGEAKDEDSRPLSGDLAASASHEAAPAGSGSSLLHASRTGGLRLQLLHHAGSGRRHAPSPSEPGSPAHGGGITSGYSGFGHGPSLPMPPPPAPPLPPAPPPVPLRLESLAPDDAAFAPHAVAPTRLVAPPPAAGAGPRRMPGAVHFAPAGPAGGASSAPGQQQRDEEEAEPPPARSALSGMPLRLASIPPERVELEPAAAQVGRG
jgi:hypothetical protein